MHVLIQLLLFPLSVCAQFGYGPITSEDGTNSPSEIPLLEDQSQDLRGVGFILEYSLIGIAVESIFYGQQMIIRVLFHPLMRP